MEPRRPSPPTLFIVSQTLYQQFANSYSDDELLSLDEAAHSVDALVSDEASDDTQRPVHVPETLARRLVSLGSAVSEVQHETMSESVLSQDNARTPRTVSAGSKASHPPGVVTPEKTPQKSHYNPPLGPKSVKSAAEGGHSRMSPHSQRIGLLNEPSSLQDKHFPALGTPKTSKDQMGSPAVPTMPTPKVTPAPKKHVEKVYSKPLEVSAEDPGSASNTPLTEHAQAARAIGSKPGEASSGASAAYPLLRTASSTSPSTSAPHPAPKTLRVVPAARVEPHHASSYSAAGLPKAVPISQRPDTPASELISDTASVISASVSNSRAGSPPPTGKIGAAPVRGATKSQQRKQRREATKQETSLMEETSKAEREDHAPVIGRKKKQKKEKPTRPALARSRSTTPAQEPLKDVSPVSANAEKLDAKHRAAEEGLEAESIEGLKLRAGRGEDRAKEPGKENATTAPLATPPGGPAQFEGSEFTEKLQPGPTSVYADIRDSLWTSAIDKLHMLRPVIGSFSRADHAQSTTGNKSGYCKDCACKCGEIQEEDLAALRSGKPVRKQFHVDGSRLLITPNGDCIRGLTPEEEDGFLDLQTAIAKTADNPGAFVAPRHQPGSGAFSLIKGRAVPNGRPNIFPAAAQPQPQDPIGKLQREDALSYINQYVLPRLNLGATNVGFPKGASPIRDSAAASLNSLAPYFYGPDAAAGVGIYSAPDGARAIQDFSSPPMQGEEPGKGAANGVGGMPLMSVEDAEGALAAARRETEKLEKSLNSVIKRNRRLLLGGGN